MSHSILTFVGDELFFPQLYWVGRALLRTVPQGMAQSSERSVPRTDVSHGRQIAFRSARGYTVYD